METTLVELFKHNRWANLRLLDACASLSDEQLEASVSGTFGSVRNTLVHLLAAEGRYVMLLTGEQQERPLRESDEFPGFEALRTSARHSGDALIKVASADPFEKILRGTRGDRPYAIPAPVPLIQAINHATEHREQVKAILSQQGIEPPDVSAWSYNERSDS